MEQATCPKCGKPGRQEVSYSDASHRFAYLRYRHKSGSACYIGRLQGGKGILGELDKSPKPEDYEKAVGEMVRQIRDLLNSYSPNTAVRMGVITPKLLGILEKYGY